MWRMYFENTLSTVWMEHLHTPLFSFIYISHTVHDAFNECILLIKLKRRDIVHYRSS